MAVAHRWIARRRAPQDGDHAQNQVVRPDFSEIALRTLVFALAMGFAGGFIPAWRAARMKTVDRLREA